MCGIAGIFAHAASAPPPSARELIAIRDHMFARGPDGEGAWTSADGRCALANRRLKILDLSDHANQPMTSEDGRFAITFNGEIYNYPDLRRRLSAEGVRFRTTADTEALLHLYARHGPDMLAHINGMYAFAIWDETERGLFLARDPYGIKPLYYSHDGGTFRFASQAKSLMAGGAIACEIDPAGLAGFLLLGSTPEPFTLYRAVSALPAGASVWVSAAGPGEPSPFASITADLAQSAGAPTPTEWRAHVRAAALESVRAHLLSDVEVGVFLSAGVDSSAVLGLMRDAGQERIRALTVSFEEFAGTPDDEAPLAALAARRYAAEHIVRRVPRAEFLADMARILAAMDQPSIDGVNTWFVAKAAHEAGLKVALSGLGGDELFAGYSTFESIPRLVRIFALAAKAPKLGAFARRLIGVLNPGLVRANPKALALAELAGTYPGAYLVRRGLFMPHELPALIGEERAREGLDRLDALAHIAARMTPDPRSANARVCALESQLYMRNQLLRDADWAGMAHSIEIRTPLVDYALLKKMAPYYGAFADGAGKRALADAPSAALPDTVVNRPKTGFSVPIAAWMSSAETAPRRNDRLASRRWALRVLEAFGVEVHSPA